MPYQEVTTKRRIVKELMSSFYSDSKWTQVAKANQVKELDSLISDYYGLKQDKPKKPKSKVDSPTSNTTTVIKRNLSNFDDLSGYFKDHLTSAKAFDKEIINQMRSKKVMQRFQKFLNRSFFQT